MPPQPFEYSPEDLLDLPVEDVALAILRDAEANGEWNAQNWIRLAAGGYPAPAVKRLSEGWQWLFSKGAVAADYRQSAYGSFFITAVGKTMLEDGIGRMVADERLAMDLHPSLDQKVRRQFLLGEYDLAVFAAFRQLEVTVRTLIEASDSHLGTALMRTAFGESGRLRQEGLDSGELDARAHLFAGAIGVFKNPTSHRDIDLSDPIEAAESIFLADLLIRLAERIASEIANSDPVLEGILEEFRSRGIGR